MQTLLLDAGNTSLKWSILSGERVAEALSDQERIFYDGASPIETLKTLLDLVKGKIDSLTLVSVLGDDFTDQAGKLSQENSINFENIQSQKKLVGVTNAYEEVHKLGADRFVAMIAAHHLSQAACLVIDIGTATTIDAINDDGQHLGGLILPSADLCSESLLKNTAQLSNFNTGKRTLLPELFATDTKHAISSASVLGLAGAIDVICDKMENQIVKNPKQQLSRILCGGGTEIILPHLQGKYRVYENLIMLGLRKIVQENN